MTSLFKVVVTVDVGHGVLNEHVFAVMATSLDQAEQRGVDAYRTASPPGDQMFDVEITQYGGPVMFCGTAVARSTEKPS